MVVSYQASGGIMSTTPTRRRRPHPARRARKLAGAVSVAGLFVLTGCMAATTKTSTRTSSAIASAATNTTSTTSATSAEFSSDDSASASRSATGAAVASTASAQSVTSTHAS